MKRGILTALLVILLGVQASVEVLRKGARNIQNLHHP